MTKKELGINYKEMRDWLACPNCESRKAKIEEGRLQLYCPSCNTRQNMVEK